ncbi:Zonula occludens toxin [uncultured Eubacterium sp.]|nr:Zonula occludens toxin [uncultured Eubacterium sp.]
MIWLYSGTPGSGKSYHATADIYYRLKRRKGKRKNKVIANFPLSLDTSDFTYLDNSQLTVRRLYNYARFRHKMGVEGQTLVVIDEAQVVFNSRNWNTDSHSRMDWIIFFTQHRKLGFDFILIAQNDRMIDRQIRCLIEYEVAHMKIGNYFRILPVTAFLAVQRWYGQKMKVSHDVIVYRKRIAKLYDSYMMFDGHDAGRYKSRKLARHKWSGKGARGCPPLRLRRSPLYLTT